MTDQTAKELCEQMREQAEKSREILAAYQKTKVPIVKAKPKKVKE